MLNTRICLALAVLISPVAALSQNAKPASANSTLRITSRIVYVDVVVRDRASHIVRGLTEKDFHLLEGGKPQTVVYFADHTHDFSAPVEVPPSKTEFSNVGPVSNSVNIVLMDFWNTATQDQPYARKQMIRFLEALPPGHQTALFVLGGRLRMLQNFTGNTDRLVAAAKAMELKPSVMRTTGEQQQEADLVTSFIEAMGRSASPNNAAADGLSLQGGDETQRAMDITREALSEIAAAVSGYPGRKNLYWLADQFPLFGGPALEIHELADDVAAFNTSAQAPPAKMAGLPEPLSPQDIAEANQGLANAQIAIYPILLTGVDASGMEAEARGITNPQQLFTYRTQLHTMMDNLAYTTGGQAYYGTNDFAGALRKGFDDGSSYYTLAYVPQNGNWNGAFRKIKIEMAAHGYSLSYRRGYFATRDNSVPEDPAKELNAALQPATPESTMLRLRSKIVMPDKQHPYLTVDTAVDPAGIDLTTDAAGVRHGKLLVLLVAMSAGAVPKNGGKGIAPPDSPPQTSGTLHLDFTPDEYRSVLKTGIQFGLKLPLNPGNYRLRLGVTDLNNNRIGTLDMPVQVDR
ncbi:MAG: VWA domain-containing protein [Acidobacteriaceae bacterium]